jgi:hypothetical protein
MLMQVLNLIVIENEYCEGKFCRNVLNSDWKEKKETKEKQPKVMDSLSCPITKTLKNATIVHN